METTPATIEDLAAMTPNERAELIKDRPLLSHDDLDAETARKFLDKGAAVEARRGRIRSGQDRGLFEIVAVLPEHEFHGGAYWDKHIGRITRAHLEEYRRRLDLIERRHPAHDGAQHGHR